MNSFDNIFDSLPVEVVVLLLENNLSDRLNLLRCVNQYLKWVVDEFFKTSNKTTDPTIYLESQNLRDFAKSQKIIVNQDAKRGALKKGMSLSYEFLYPFTRNIIKKLIRLNSEQYDDMLIKLISDWPFFIYKQIETVDIKAFGIYMSFLLESSDKVFDAFLNSSFGEIMTTYQIRTFVDFKPKRTFRFSFEHLNRFFIRFPTISLTHLKFKFPKDFKYQDFISYQIPFYFLQQIDFALFKHQEPILTEIFQKKSLTDLCTYYSTLMQPGRNDVTYVPKAFQKTCSFLCLKYQWLVPFLHSETSFLTHFSLYDGYSIPLIAEPLYYLLLPKMSDIDILLYSDDNFFNWIMKNDLTLMSKTYLMMIVTRTTNFIPTKRCQQLGNHLFRNFEESDECRKIKQQCDVSLENNRVQKIIMLFSCCDSPNGFWLQFILNLDQIYNKQQKDVEFKILNEFADSFQRKKPSNFHLTLGDFESIKHTELLPILLKFITFDKDNSPWEVISLVKHIDEHVLDFLIETLPFSQRQMKNQYISKIKSPKVFIKAHKNNFLTIQPLDTIGPFVISCCNLFLVWDRTDLFQILFENDCIKCWMESFGHIITTTINVRRQFSYHQIDYLTEYFDELIKSQE